MNRRYSSRTRAKATPMHTPMTPRICRYSWAVSLLRVAVGTITRVVQLVWEQAATAPSSVEEISPPFSSRIYTVAPMRMACREYRSYRVCSSTAKRCT